MTTLGMGYCWRRGHHPAHFVMFDQGDGAEYGEHCTGTAVWPPVPAQGGLTGRQLVGWVVGCLIAAAVLVGVILDGTPT